mgnify:CR=1 FL=1
MNKIVKAGKMKKRELKRLLELFDQNNQRHSDYHGFSDPDQARKSYEDLLLFRRKPSDIKKDFSPCFTERVINRITHQTQIPRLEEYLSMQLNRVMTYGLTAVILVFLTLYFLQGQDGIGTVIGTNNSNDINFISYLFYEF